MIILGLTGSLAAGKSTIVKMLHRLHIPVFDADIEVHKLLKHNRDVTKAVEALCPEAVKNNRVSRRILGKFVFSNPKKLEKLEAILHPKVHEMQRLFIKEMQRSQQPIIVLDVPLLFETGWQSEVDKTILVTAKPFLQKQRAFQRLGMTEERFHAIHKRQLSDDKKKQMADYCLDSGLGKAVTFRQLLKIINSFQIDRKEPIDTGEKHEQTGDRPRYRNHGSRSKGRPSGN